MSELEREIQIAQVPAPEPMEVPPVEEDVLEYVPDLTGAPVEEGGLPPALKALIARCMAGTEPMGRTMRKWEVDKFSARHVNICLLRAAGFKPREIAETIGYGPSQVSYILNHPYGLKIIHELVTHRGAKVIDIRTKLENYASEVLDKMYDLAQASEDLEAVSKVGFGLLDRAGYSTVQKTQSLPPERGLNSGTNLERIANALEESIAVDAVIMPSYVPKPPPDESRDSVGSGSPADRSKAEPAPSDRGLSDGGIRLARVGT